MAGQASIHRVLERGEHYGTIERQTLSSRTTVSEVDYPPEVRHGPHENNDAQLIFIEKGRYQKTVGHAEFSCSSGKLLFVPARHVQTDAFGNSNTRCLIVGCSSDVIQQVTEVGGRLDDAKIWTGFEFDRQFLKFKNELRSPDLFSPMLLEGLALDILVTLFRLQQKRSGNAPRWLILAKDLLHEGAAEVRSIGSVAEHVGVHPARLAAEFRRHFQCSPGDYLRKARIEQAATLLRETREPISEIASKCGFSDQAHLSRLFRLNHACTPLNYRHSFQRPKSVQNIQRVQDSA